MATAKLYNLARMTTATTGTGTITLGSAATGFISFATAGVSDGESITYAIEDGNNREIGRGTYTASGTTLTRSVLKSTNAGSAINLSGSAQVFITDAAEDHIAGPSSSVDSEIVLFSGTGGATLKRASNTGILKAASGVIATATSGTDYAPATSGSAVLKGNGSGGFSSASAGTDYVAPGGALGTPSSGTLTNCSGLPASGLVASTSQAVGFGTIELGHASDTTLSRVSAGIVAVEGVNIALNSTSSVHTASTIELGNASDTTLSRSAAGILAVEGVDQVRVSGNQTLSGGFSITSYSGGSQTGASPTYTPAAANGNIQHITLNGSSLTGTFTIGVPSTVCSIVLEILNSGSGAVGASFSTSGYTKTSGDTWASTNGNKYLAFITKSNGYSHFHLQALQ